MTSGPHAAVEGDARAVVLAALRRALVDVDDSEGVDIPIERHYRRDRTVEDPVGRFTERARATGATVTACSEDEIAATLAAVLTDSGNGPVVCATDLPQEWRCADPPLLTDEPTWDASAMGRFSAGVTGAVAAIAETGTVVLDGHGSTGRRLVSLVPDRHVCLVHSSQIVADVPQALAQLDPARPLTFVTGPSATVDIELVRTQGVHGPRDLHIVLVHQGNLHAR